MKWADLLTTTRLSDEEPDLRVFEKFEISEFEKDYRRIVSSESFRRLQDKTQVFPLDKSDFVRTRLTHSIEVSSIAKQLGMMSYKNLKNHRKDDMGYQLSSEQALEVSDVLMCAGLLHDIGNPPFGHFGEAVISQWFVDHADLEFKGASLKERLEGRRFCDLTHFEGNAQALHTLLKHSCTFNGSGSNLTCAVLATLVKYPVDSLSFDKESADIKLHKPGVYHAEDVLAKKVFSCTGTLQQDGTVARHPLTFLLESADDIAYATGDLEDAFKKRAFSLDEFVKFYRAKRDKLLEEGTFGDDEKSENLIDRLEELIKNSDGNISQSEIFQTWLEYVRRWLMYVCAYSFTSKIKQIMDGTYEKELFEETFHVVSIEILKSAMAEFVYDDFEIAKLELAAQTILCTLLDKFVEAILYYDDPKYTLTKNGQKVVCHTATHAKLCSMVSESCKSDYANKRTEDENENLYNRLLMIVDYISGMTDSYAKSLYQELCGIY